MGAPAMDSAGSQTAMTEVGEPHGGRGLLDGITDDSGPISVISESAAGTWLTSTMPEAVEPTTASRIFPTCTRRS